VLATLAAVASVVGAAIRHWEWRDRFDRLGADANVVSWEWAGPLSLAGLTLLGVFAGAMIAWPLWVGIVRLFVPRRTGEALLEWQRGGTADALGVK
jgi:hypothetical protein